MIARTPKPRQRVPEHLCRGSAFGIPCRVSPRCLFEPHPLVLFRRETLETVQQTPGQTGARLRSELESFGFQFVDAHS
jgi:hypothetical protein